MLQRILKILEKDVREENVAKGRRASEREKKEKKKIEKEIELETEKESKPQQKPNEPTKQNKQKLKKRQKLPNPQHCVTIIFGQKASCDSLDLDLRNDQATSRFIRALIYLSGAVPVLAGRHNVLLFSYLLFPSPSPFLSSREATKVLEWVGRGGEGEEEEEEGEGEGGGGEGGGGEGGEVARSVLYDLLFEKVVPPPFQALFESFCGGGGGKGARITLGGLENLLERLMGKVTACSCCPSSSTPSSLPPSMAKKLATEIFCDLLGEKSLTLPTRPSSPSPTPLPPSYNQHTLPLSHLFQWLTDEAHNSPSRSHLSRSLPCGTLSSSLSSFFISSSHNTYLEGNQLSSRSTGRQYGRVLRGGCRCVEVDVWDGEEGFPVVWHGNTLTSKV